MTYEEEWDEGGVYELCPVCGGGEEVYVGEAYSMPCPACVLGLVPHECSPDPVD